MALPDHLAHLLEPGAYPHPVEGVRLIETHISWVLIAGEFAYKIKKPVDFGFLDFSTPSRRRHCCEEEIRLNRRLAPDIYLDVAPVTDSGISGTGEVSDWAVRMRAFSPDATLDRQTAIAPEQIDAIADRVARFHGDVSVAPTNSEYGTAESTMRPVRDNLLHIAALLPAGHPETARLARLSVWSEREHVRLAGHFASRRRTGHIRECHGDLHLGNIAWIAGAPLIFDCIEFNPGLRYIDVTSEIAFLFMDLAARGENALAWRFLNRYHELTGDYAGLTALRFHMVYRALVRAKVACLRANQDGGTAFGEMPRYLALSERLGQPGRPFLVLMHGYSGSGKTWLSQRLLEQLGAVRLRSDVERKRLFGLPALADSKCAVGDIYTPDAGRRTFARLRELTGTLLDDGFPVIVDATFLSHAGRNEFITLAKARAIPWRIVSLNSDTDTLRARIALRQQRADDASEADQAVLENQLRTADPLSAEESAHTLTYDGTGNVETLFPMLSNPTFAPD